MRSYLLAASLIIAGVIEAPGLSRASAHDLNGYAKPQRLAFLPASPDVTFVCKGEGDRRPSQDSPFPDRVPPFRGDAMLKLAGDGTATLRIPAALIPSLHGRAPDGWWPVRNLQVDKAEVRGAVSFNLFDTAHFIIDKGLGVMTLDANLGRFIGRCETIKPE